MRTTHIKVGYSRSKQPAQYESANPSVEFAVTVDEDEHIDPTEAAKALMFEAATVVYNALGTTLPKSVGSYLVGTVETTVIDDNAKTDKVTSVETTDESEIPDTSEKLTKVPKKRGPGRPKKAAAKKEVDSGIPDTKSVEPELKKSVTLPEGGIQEIISKALSEKKLESSKVMATIKKYKAARIADISEDQKDDFINDILGMIKDA